MQKRIISALFCFLFFGSAVWAIPYNITGGTYTYNWGAGTASASGSLGNYLLTYSKPTSADGAGIGISLNPSWTLVNLSTYITLSLNINSNSPVINVTLIYFNDGDPADDAHQHESGVVQVQGITSGSYKTYTVSLSGFAGVNLARVKAIQIAPQQIGTNLTVGLQSMNFNNVAPPPAQYFVTGGTYPYTWGAGAASDSGSNGTYQLTYSKSTAADGAGIGISLNPDWNVVDLTSYVAVSMNVQSDSSVMNVSLIYFNNGDPIDDAHKHESAAFQITGVPSGSFKKFSIPLSNFTGANLARVRVVQIAPQQIGSNLTVHFNTINFNNGVEPPSNPITTELLITSLINAGKVGANDYPMLTSTSDYKQYISNVWAGYKKTFVDSYRTVAPAYAGLVFDPFSGDPSNAVGANDYSTSEAAAYGMLLALYTNDRNTFDEIFNRIYSTTNPAYDLYKTGSTKLFSWKFDKNGILDVNSATDADQDIALALIFADELKRNNISVWGSSPYDYSSKAQELIDAIYKNDYEYYKYIRLGDYNFGGRALTNPSYFSPAWYRIFDMYENTNHDWQYIIDQGYQLMADISAKNGNMGVWPDWCDSWGNSYQMTHPADTWAAYRQEKNAIRVYWRLATDYVWFGDTRARNFLVNTKTMFDTKGKSPSTITELYLNGDPVYPTHNWSDISYVGMFSAGAMGLNEAGYLTYRAQWKNEFDTYLADALQGDNSFFSKAYPDGKYNYYNQSLGLLSALLISGAFPDVYKDLVKPTSISSLVTTGLPTKVYNNSLVQVPVKVSSTAGGGFIKQVSLQINPPGGASAVILQATGKSTQEACTTVQDVNNVVKLASAQSAVVGNDLYVTFNVLVSAGWAAGAMSFGSSAVDEKNNSLSNGALGSATYFNYADDYLSKTKVAISFGSVSSFSDKIISFPNPLDMACSSATWNLNVYTDNHPTHSGDAGLVMVNGDGTISANIPLNILIKDTAVTPGVSDVAWKAVNDRQDPVDMRILSGTALLPKTSKYIYLKANFARAKVGYYSTDLYLRLTSLANLNLVDNFEDGSTRTEMQSYWSSVPINTGTSVVSSVVANALDPGNSYKVNYTLGQTVGNTGPQAITLFTMAASNSAQNILNKYKGISFCLKAENGSRPLAVVLESKIVNPDYDYFLYPLVSPSDKWVKYTVYFADFKQAGFGAAKSINTVLTSVDSIQFKTLSDKPGEAGSFYIDNVMFVQ